MTGASQQCYPPNFTTFNLKAISLLIAMGVLSVTAVPASGVSSETELVALNVPDSYNDRISSIRNLDKRRFHCEDANLHDGDGFFSDRISSWRCNTRQGRVAVAGVDDVEGGEQQ
ncbi:hypothetical protein B0T21DRAFT_387614 [Apiosordaria backusii]|uniref:Uncharacterized protein n=1 Tax=Apiosordaria backusii TaxID=314023 RepID=A0AA40A4D4_9PEZI|nr:hypothetical protein B0T21DRAFT_387614 [Apiosordaria backusii]